MPYKDPEVRKRKARERYWNKRDEILAKAQKHREENREAVTTYSKEYYKKNKDKYRESNKKWLEKNPGYWKTNYLNNVDARRDYARKREADRRKYISDIKTDSGCIICGYNVCSKALEFHHIHGGKEESVSQLARSSMDKLNAEIEKCVVLCSNCHRELHDGVVDLPSTADC